ncbi:MAG TPA: hypothetical protein VGL59_25810 [Polyangia bacterium]|jgi:hypothetical protein
MNGACLSVACLVSVLGACGGSSGVDGPGVDAAAESPSGDTGDDTPDDSAGAADVPHNCATESAALALALHAIPSAECTAVVRVDYQSFAIFGYQLICGPKATVTEAQARATANTDTGYGASADTAPALNPPDPADEYVFFQAPNDLGGAAAVSARNGQTVFGGGVVFAGKGDIKYPATWKPAADLGSNCLRAEGIPSSRGRAVGADATTTGIAAAIDAVSGTAIPAAMWRSGRVIDAVVLAYARSVGIVNGGANTFADAEWIVLVNSD